MTSVVPTKRCLSCGAPIIWAVNDSSGLRMPVDPEPVDDGNILLSVVASGQSRAVGIGKVRCGPGTIIAHVVRKGEEVEPSRPRRVAHFVSCPEGPLWKNKKRESK